MAEGSGEVSRQRLFAALRSRWSAATSVDPAWSSGNPALGQCAVTALVIQEYLGGDLIRAKVGTVSHYWNRLPDGDIDLTREQFSRFVPTDVSVQQRERLLNNSETRSRYERLLSQVTAEFELRENIV
ncbi:YunG family protein [Actinophytocola xanthii]|uniref:YunG family protein n=1 Tax=Actinophytocola xanthii TaxID=1912961 RepID=UPI0011785A7F|nr:hypothetical protein [Actinophytocola xanthii]